MNTINKKTGLPQTVASEKARKSSLFRHLCVERGFFFCIKDWNKIDLILTKSISRFARNTVDTLQTVRKLKAAGVEVIFEKENLHTFDPKCEIMLTIMSSMAQEESRSISENIKWSKQKGMQAGKVHLAYSNFLGYKKGEDGRLEIVEKEAKIVRMIYDLFLSGETIHGVAAYLTKNGIPSPTGKTKWYVSTIKSILSNEKYKGDELLQKTYIADYLTKEVRRNDGEVAQYLVENSHEAIISPETFALVQRRLSHQAAHSRKLRDNSIFSSRLVCGECGAFYGHKVWHNRANTERYDVWCCNHRYSGEEKCQALNIREEKLREAYISALTQKYGADVAPDEKQWRRWVERVTVYPDGKMNFLFEDDTEITIFCDVSK